uniref:Uncharacterized protein n=1 Tax=Salix viminalis TaxID=40686 RepID=A0A6N2KYA3_SALVM
MHDPAYLSLLRSLGWKDDDNEHTITPFNPQESDNLSTQTSNPLVTQSTSNISWRTPRRCKAEIQRELLGLKRKALTLRHEGKIDEAEEVLIAAKALETQIEGMETLKKEIQIESNKPKDEIVRPINSEAEEGDVDDIAEKDMHDPSLLSMLTNLGWKDDGVEAVTVQAKPSKQVLDHLVHSNDPSTIPPSSSISAARPRSKGEVQRELLGLKRKALSLRRNGETEEAEEFLKMAKVLESQIDDLEGPKKELFPDASEDKKYQSSGSLNNHEKQNNVNNAVEMIEKLAAAAVDTNEKFIESFTGSGRKGSDKTAPPSWSPDIVNQVPFEINEENHPYVGDFDLLGEMGSLSNSRVNQGTEFFPPPNQSMNLMDLLTGDDWSSPQIPARKLEDKVDFGSDISCLLEPHVHVGSLRSGLEHLRSKDREASSISDVSHFPDHHVHTGSMIHAPEDLGSTENVRIEDLLDPHLLSALKAIGIEDTSIISQSSERPGPAKVSATKSENNSQERTQFEERIKAEVKAVNLKRAGKQAEALDALRRAKLYEKKLNSL